MQKTMRETDERAGTRRKRPNLLKVPILVENSSKGVAALVPCHVAWIYLFRYHRETAVLWRCLRQSNPDGSVFRSTVFSEACGIGIRPIPVRCPTSLSEV